ncbi:MAG: GAF domain-containing protein [Acidobacteriia bacterium]|jgi:adenylate cyclase|nr:GAF domain-containing protein [Terriglobia bacterium]
MPTAEATDPTLAPPPAAPPAKQPRVKKRSKQTSLLLQIATKVAAAETLDEILRYIVEVSVSRTDAERGSLFLNDEKTNELYSRVAQGVGIREIRLLNDTGIAGAVFKSGQGLIIDDAYSDSRFNSQIDVDTGFTTRNLLCAPITTPSGDVIGVLQILNKREGNFTADDLILLESMTEQTSMTLRSAQVMERVLAARQEELKFLDMVGELTSDLDLSTMLARVVTEAARMLQADRASLFLNDEKKNELFSRVAMGAAVGEIRLPNTAGIAGAVFTSGQVINIPYAYADLRFNPAFDKKTGYFTRSILCVPIVNKAGKRIGVTQVLNKKGGPFTDQDEKRLKVFTAQLAISLENAKLFDDIQNIKNYNEGVLQSMSNGVITLNEDGKIVTCNHAGERIFKVHSKDLIQKPAADFFTGPNQFVMERIAHVNETLKSDIMIDADMVAGDEKLSVNLTVLPLMSEPDKDTPAKKLGTLIMIEDVSSEKRMKSTMSRYMDPAIAEQLMEGGGDALGGKSVIGTVLFCDIRGFTSITEDLGAQGTVMLLNEYFTIMVDCITKQGGMLDKFIGDAIMAVFGLPLPHEDDEDRAVRACISMITELRRWNAERAAAGKKPVDIGIGLNTDTIVSGNIGSPKRMDYTVIGDGVNLASRLESACKEYSARILISENTFTRLKGTYRVREVDMVVVKGKTEPVAVFEVLDYHTPDTFPNLRECMECFRDGLSNYRRQDWDKADECFNAALAANPGDNLSKTYLKRVMLMRENPPGAEWNGTWVMKSK